MHGNMFNYYPSGTSEDESYLNDIVTLGQGDRGIMEFKFGFDGRYMFHSHVTEFSELGWMGVFDVKKGG
jgi:FtsP/CotA-like multicopper oxidase with cupredoxin domain